MARYRVGRSKRDLLAFPEPVKDRIGTALSVAQFGGKHPSSKALEGRGAGRPGGLRGSRPYRAVYTLRLEGAVYVLHAFQKKSPRVRIVEKWADRVARVRHSGRESIGAGAAVTSCVDQVHTVGGVREKGESPEIVDHGRGCDEVS
jgi:phage-related protein